MTSNTASGKTNSVKSVQAAKRAFFVALFDISWKMLGSMLVPIFVGLWLDSIFDSGKIFGLAGFVIGIFGGVFIIKGIITKAAKEGYK